MFEKFLSGNIENFRQRYEGTYGFFRDAKGKRLLVKLQQISTERCDFVSADSISYHITPDHPNEVGFEFLPPKSAWYNTQQWGAVYTQRLAQRQWSRGVTSKTLEIYALLNGNLNPKRVDFFTLGAIYEKAISPKDAFNTEWNSLAISGQFALDKTTKTVRVLKEQIGVFDLNGRSFKFVLDEPQLWRTEISDAIKAMGCVAEIN